MAAFMFGPLGVLLAVVAVCAVAAFAVHATKGSFGPSRRRRERAMRMHMEISDDPPSDSFDRYGKWRGAPTPCLEVENRTGEMVTSVAVDVEHRDGYFAYVGEGVDRLEANATFRVRLPKDHGNRVRVAWTDSDGARWSRRHVGVEFILERVRSKGSEGAAESVASTWSSRRAEGWPDCWQ